MVAILAGALAAGIFGLRPGLAGPGAARDLAAAFFEDARAMAVAGSDGATILIEEDGPRAGILRLVAGRPHPGGAFDGGRLVRFARLPAPIRTSLGAPPVAVFVDPAGTWTAAAWAPGGGILRAEPACDALVVTFGTTDPPANLTFRCGSFEPER